MKKARKILIVKLSIVTIFYLGMRFERFSSSISETGKPSIYSQTIRLEDSFDEFFYFTKKRWGITGNHEEKIISTKRYYETNESDRIVFPGEERLLYKTESDKLIVYTRTKPLSVNKISKELELEIIELNDKEF